MTASEYMKKSSGVIACEYYMTPCNGSVLSLDYGGCHGKVQP